MDLDQVSHSERPVHHDDEQTRSAPEVSPELLREWIIAALREVYDPEIPVNIYDLGLIYGIDIAPGGQVDVQMTLTAPGCPVAQTFPGTVEAAIEAVDGVGEAHVELVWDPPWTLERMDDAAKLQLGML